jgi:hypothetical protein
MTSLKLCVKRRFFKNLTPAPLSKWRGDGGEVVVKIEQLKK